MSPAVPSVVGAVLDEREHLQKNWWVFLLLGLVGVVAGTVAISSSFVATLASVFVLGILLVVSGIAEVIHAIMVRNFKGFALHLLAAALYLFVGVFMLEDPVQAAMVLTLILAASFFVGGILRIIFSFVVQFPAWGWVAFNGLINLILGGMIFKKWPDSALWVIGLFVGIDLLIHGWSWVVLALSVRSHRRPHLV